MVPGAQGIAGVAIVAVPILVAVVFHEVAHGAVAYAFGDLTAARAGRLTLNPIPHIDPFGTVHGICAHCLERAPAASGRGRA